MPSFQEQIKDYVVTLVRSEPTGSSRFIQVNFMFFPGNVVLRFMANPTSPVGELTKVKGMGNGAVAYQAKVNLPLTDYADYLDLLRHEQPVWITFAYDTEPALGQKVPVAGCRLFTNSPEPVGEGPVDKSN